VESLVAAGLLGLTAVGGMTAWDTAIIGSRQAVREAWARCVARGEMEAVLDAPYTTSGYAAPAGVSVTTAGTGQFGVQELQEVIVSASAGGPAGKPYTLRAMKARATAGSMSIDTAEITAGCPAP
jgi:hypothetical protein